MKKNVWVLAVLGFSMGLYAQEASMLSKNDMMTAFQIYNPSVLENAKQNEGYQSILQQLLDSYSVERNEKNELELIALVKNFDNSLALHLIKQQYMQGRQLQDMSGVPLSNLEQSTLENLEPVFARIYQNTLEVKNIQLKQYKESLKKIKKDSSLSADEKAEQISLYKEKISQVKQEVKQLKQNSKARVHALAAAYLAQMEAGYTSALAQQLSAAESTNQDIKSNHKKPVAK